MLHSHIPENLPLVASLLTVARSSPHAHRSFDRRPSLDRPKFGVGEAPIRRPSFEPASRGRRDEVKSFHSKSFHSGDFRNSQYMMSILNDSQSDWMGALDVAGLPEVSKKPPRKPFARPSTQSAARSKNAPSIDPYALPGIRDNR